MLLLITLLAGRLAGRIPMATLAAILIVVAYNMSEWRVFRAELRAPRSDVLVLLSTFLLTVLVDLTVAIRTGMVLAAFLFVRRMAEESGVRPVTQEFAIAEREEDSDVGEPDEHTALPPDVQAFYVTGALFFGAAESFRERLGQVAKRPRVLILRLGAVPAIDSTGLRALEQIATQCGKEGTRLILSELGAQPRRVILNSPLAAQLGSEGIAATYAEAVATAG